MESIQQHLDDRIAFLKKFKDKRGLVSHHEQLKDSVELIHSACCDQSIQSEEMHVMHAKFDGGLRETKKALKERAVDTQSSISYPQEWNQIIQYILACGERKSDAMLSINSLKKRFPDRLEDIEDILQILNKRRIIFLFPFCEYFCPSPYHLQSLCKIAVDHTCKYELHEMVKNAKS